MLVQKTNNIVLIHELDKQCFDKPYSMETYKNMMDNHIFFVLSNNKINLGFIIFLVVDENVELIKIGIIKKYRQKGFASYFLTEVIKTINFKKMFLEVSTNNIPAIKLYQKLGFYQINTRKSYYENGSDAIVLCYNKELTM